MSDLTELADVLLGMTTGEGVTRRKAVVQSVQTASVTIRLGGGTTDIAGVRHVASYAPESGDVVEVVADGPALLVIGTVQRQTRTASSVVSYVAGVNNTFITYATAFSTQSTHVVACLGDGTGPTSILVYGLTATGFYVRAYTGAAEFGGGLIRVNYLAWGN